MAAAVSPPDYAAVTSRVTLGGPNEENLGCCDGSRAVGCSGHRRGQTIDPAQFGLHVETLGAGVAPQIGVKACGVGIQGRADQDRARARGVPTGARWTAL